MNSRNKNKMRRAVYSKLIMFSEIRPKEKKKKEMNAWDEEISIIWKMFWVLLQLPLHVKLCDPKLTCYNEIGPCPCPCPRLDENIFRFAQLRPK